MHHFRSYVFACVCILGVVADFFKLFSIHLLFAFRLAHGKFPLHVPPCRLMIVLNVGKQAERILNPTGRVLLWTVLLPVCFSNCSAEDSVGIKPNRHWEINPNLPICVTIHIQLPNPSSSNRFKRIRCNVLHPFCRHRPVTEINRSLNLALDPRLDWLPLLYWLQ